MAVRLHFIVEGQTEETFVNRVLGPHLANQSIWAKARCVMTSRKRGIKHRGGIATYLKARNDISAWTAEDQNSDARFTTMFDLYRLPDDFPGYKESVAVPNPYQRVRILEESLGKDISDWRFVPYIQLHEFEALLLCHPEKLATQFPDRSTETRKLTEEMASFDSPEHVNDGCHTAPSKRIIKVIPEYAGMKRSAGPLVADKIGLVTLRSGCRHFGEWLGKLEALA